MRNTIHVNCSNLKTTDDLRIDRLWRDNFNIVRGIQRIMNSMTQK